MSLRQPQLKRRRLSSNSFVPLLAPNMLAASLKPSRISTCTSCHRTIGLKSSPPLVCTRCSASTCAICVRTCTGDPLPSSRGTGSRNPSPRRISSPTPSGGPNASFPSRRRRARDDDADIVLKLKGSEREGTGCGRMICRKCCLEIPQRETVACLDWIAAHPSRPLQAHGSDASMQEAIIDHTLTAST